MKYKYHWTLWIPIIGYIRFWYIGFKYKFTVESYPYKMQPFIYSLYQSVML